MVWPWLCVISGSTSWNRDRWKFLVKNTIVYERIAISIFTAMFAIWSHKVNFYNTVYVLYTKLWFIATFLIVLSHVLIKLDRAVSVLHYLYFWKKEQEIKKLGVLITNSSSCSFISCSFFYLENCFFKRFIYWTIAYVMLTLVSKKTVVWFL